MKSTRRVVGLASGLVASFALTVLGATPASAATWTLNLQHDPKHVQTICIQENDGGPVWSYFLAPITGTSSKVIKTGINNMPAGSTVENDWIYPDYLNRRGQFVGMIFVTIPQAPTGDHMAELWASDGTETQTGPVRILYRENCLA